MSSLLAAAASPDLRTSQALALLREHGLAAARALVAAAPPRRLSTLGLLPWTIGLDPRWPGVQRWLDQLDPAGEVAARHAERFRRAWLDEPAGRATPPARDPEARVVRAATLYEEGRPVSALRDLLAAWEDTRDPDLAELTTRLRFACAPPPLLDRRDWLARAPTLDVVELGALLAQPAAVDLEPADVLALGPEPRVARWFLARIREDALSLSRLARWRALREAVGALRCPAVGLAWAGRRDALERVWPSEDWAVPAIPPAAPSEAVAALRARLPADDAPEERLLAAIYAAPEADEPRLVYADWLSERGDPRGELVTLQCTGGSPSRVRALLAQHRDRWARRPRGAVSPVFERGFPARARVSRGCDLSDPAWATVHSLHAPEPPDVLDWPHLRRLRVDRVSTPLLLRSRTLTALDLPWSGPTWALPDPAALPAVRELVLRVRSRPLAPHALPAPLDLLDRWPITALGLTIPLRALPAVAAALEAHPTLTRLACWQPEVSHEAPWGWVIALERSGGPFTRARAWTLSPAAARVSQLAELAGWLRERAATVAISRPDPGAIAPLVDAGLAVTPLGEVPDPFAPW